MTRTLIPCPICHGSTKEIQGVLACIANCRTQFWGLSQDKWYVATNDELEAALEKVRVLELDKDQLLDNWKYEQAVSQDLRIQLEAANKEVLRLKSWRADPENKEANYYCKIAQERYNDSSVE